MADGYLGVDGKVIYQMNDFSIRWPPDRRAALRRSTDSTILVTTSLASSSSMKYSNVYIDSIGYEIAPVVVSSAELERRLEGSLRGACTFRKGSSRP